MIRSIFSVSIAMVASLASAQAASDPLGSPDARAGGTFSLNLGGEPESLNPITASDLYSQKVHAYVLDTLLDRNEDTYGWEPALAEKWEISKDGKEFTFVIREAAKWHDGKPVTVEDVKFSFDAIFDDRFKAAHLRPYYEGIKEVKIVDGRTVKFVAKSKYFKNLESAATMSIIPKHVYGDPEKGHKLNKTVVGSGPYRLGKNEQGKRLILEKNAGWWGNSVPYYKGKYNFAKIIVRFVKEQNIALEMLKKADLDFEEFTPETYVEKAKGDIWGTKVHKVKVENQAPGSYGYVGFNFRKAMFQDKRVRRAIAHLMNRELMIEKFRYGMSLLATGPWYQQSVYASSKVDPIEFDPKEARDLLKEVGWEDTDKDGLLDKEMDGKRVPFRFTLAFPSQDVEKYYTIFKEDARKAGVEINLKLIEWNSFLKLVDEGKFDTIAMGWGGGSVDLDPKQIWHSSSAVEGGSNFIGYKNPEVDKLIDEAREVMDNKARIPVLRKVYETIAEDVPYIFMFNNKFALYGHTAKVEKPKDTYKFAIGIHYWWSREP